MNRPRGSSLATLKPATKTIFGFAVLLSATVSGCGNSGDDAPTTESEIPVPSPTFPRDESSLTAYLGLGPISIVPDDANSPLAAENRRVETAVAECMTAAGYSYTPEAVDDDPLTQPDRLVPGSDEWVTKYGLGISTLAFPQEAVGDEALGYLEATEANVEPNEAYRASLSEAEGEAYNKALYGDDGQGGCFDAAVETVNVAALVDFSIQFERELDDLAAKVALHPAMAKHEDMVGECLSENEVGADYVGRDEVEAAINQQLLPFFQAVYEEVGDRLEAGDGDDLSTDEAIDALLAPEPLDPEETKQLAAIQDEERRLARLLEQCGDSAETRREIKQLALMDLEQQFIEDNRDALDAFRASYQP